MISYSFLENNFVLIIHFYWLLKTRNVVVIVNSFVIYSL